MSSRAIQWRTLGVAVGVPAIAAVVTLLSELAAGSSAIGTDPVRMAITGRAAVLVAAGVVGAIWASRLSLSVKAYTAAVTVGVVLSSVLYVGLLGTPFGINGIDGDAGFHTALVTHSAAVTFPFPDLSYSELPSWYSPLYYWSLGKASVVLGIEPFKMIKFGALVVSFLLPIVVFASWRHVTGHVLGGLAGAAALLLVNDVYKVSGWIAVALFIPWWLRFIDGIGPPMSTRHRVWWGGITGGLLFMTYPFYFAVGALAFAVRLLLRRSGGWQSEPRVRTPLLVIGVSAATSAPYWLPLGLSMIREDETEFLMTRYVTRALAEVPFPFLAVSLSGALLLVGLAWLTWRAASSPVARSLLTLVAAVYGWKVFVALRGALGRPSQAYRFDLLLSTVLAVAAALAIVDIGRWLAPRLGPPSRLAAGFGTLLIVAAIGQQHVDRMVDHEWAVQARETTVPGPLLDGFDQATGGVEGITVLTGELELTIYRPVYLFNTWNAHFAHPASRFSARNDFIEALSQERDPDRFAALAAENEFERIDAAVFKDFGETLVYFYADDNYPRGLIDRTIQFSRAQFDPRYWREVTSPPFVYFVLTER